MIRQKISLWLFLLLSLFLYHDYMTRVVQKAYISGYIEGMSAIQTKSIMINAYSEGEKTLIDKFILFQSQCYKQAYEDDGGTF
jgi:hypothetical protein